MSMNWGFHKKRQQKNCQFKFWRHSRLIQFSPSVGFVWRIYNCQ